MPGRSREESWWSQNRDLRTLLLKFNSSDASDTRDKIYALLGLSSDAFDSTLLRADYSKPVYSVIQDAILFLLQIPEQYHADLICRWTMPLFLERLYFLSNALLRWAVYEDNEAITTLLLARDDIDVNFRDHEDGRTPLLIAVEKSYREADAERQNDNESIIRLLLARNDIDVNFKLAIGETPLLTAVKGNRKGVVKLLLTRNDVDVNSKDKYGQALLLVAVREENMEIVKLLLARNDIDVNLMNQYGLTLLEIAVKGGNVEIVKLLLAQEDIDVSLKGVLGQTPLQIAVAEGYVEITKLLLACGAMMDELDYEQQKAFHVLMAENVELLVLNDEA